MLILCEKIVRQFFAYNLNEVDLQIFDELQWHYRRCLAEDNNQTAENPSLCLVRLSAKLNKAGL